MFLSFLIVTNFEIHTLIVDVCVCLSTVKIQYVNKCISYLDLFHNIWLLKYQRCNLSVIKYHMFNNGLDLE